METATAFDLSGRGGECTTAHGLGISIPAAGKRYPPAFTTAFTAPGSLPMSSRSTPESVSYPSSYSSMRSCPQQQGHQQQLYTPPTFQRYSLPDMTDMAEMIPYSMERVHLQETDMENFFYQNQLDAYRRPHLDSSAQDIIMPTRDSHSFDTTAISHANEYFAPHQQDWLPLSLSTQRPSEYYAESYLPQRSTSALDVMSQTSSSSMHIASTTESDVPPPQHQTLSHKDLTNYGIPNPDNTWRCAYPGCTSQTVFRRGCDLRKHYNRHRKHLFCRHNGCPQAVQGGFSSKKDRDRHEAKHNPLVGCEWEGCQRMFSRVDNMKDHVRRIHKRREP
ncbi:hypothetical protein BBP40_006419 [Aspergillus hancockii]|nr:hypothetical protein BBP40_006419 [Aspergillus hancockii]